MSELKFNLKDAKGEQRFITPLITVSNGDKVKTLDKSIRLAIGYIVKAVVENDGWNDKTKMDAGLACHETLAALPKSAKVNLYMPTLAESRDSDDVNKWTLCASVTMPEMVAASHALATTSELMAKVEKEVKAIAESVKVNVYEVKQPLYFAGESVRAKSSGGSKKITITL